MPLDFPSSPTNGQVYGNYYYNSARGAWNALLPAATPNFFTNATLNTSTLVDATAVSSTTSSIPFTVNGLSGQTASLQQWKDSAGTVLASVNIYGAIASNYLRPTAPNATAVPVIVKGAASQTANLQEWQNSSGTVFSRINSSGYFGTERLGVSSSATTIPSTAMTYIESGSSGNQGLIIRGATSQTADLQQWQSSTGAVLSEINSAGELQVPRIGVGSVMPSTTHLFVTAAAAANIPIIAQGAASQTGDLQRWQNNSGVVLSYVNSAGHFVSPGINWIMLSAPVVSEFSFTGTINTSWTLNASVPTNARYVLANVYITASSSDHQNFTLSATQWSNAKNWVDTRGSQPSGQFGSLTQKDHITLTYFGEVDGFSSNYGIWYNSLDIPTTGRTVWVNNYGNSGSNGWVYFVIRGYSL